MKRLVAIVLCFAFLLGGCSNIFDRFKTTSTVSELNLTQSDSVVKLDIYPENSGFDVPKPFDRANYQLLNDRQKSIYIQLDNAVYSMQTGYIPLGICTERDFDLAYYALRYDRPEYFWMPLTYYIRTVGNSIEVSFAEKESDWLCTKAERIKCEGEIRAKIVQLLGGIDKGMSEYDKELCLHDRLVDTVVYDSKALQSPDSCNYAWNIDGAFLNGKAVCEGYAKAMQVLLSAVGLECSVVIGKIDEPHMWNIVKVDGHWYHLDATHNDTTDMPNHFFFNVTTEYMLNSRTIAPTVGNIDDSQLEQGDFNIFLPISTYETLNYHIVNGTYIGSMEQVESTVVSLICEAVRDKRKSVEFSVSKNVGFVFGETDAAEFFNLGRCVSAANAELSQKQRIYTYTYGGVTGALGFVILW